MEEISVVQRLLDGGLALVLIWLAWQSIESDDLFRGVVLFISFGLLMALAWLRLKAPDVAMAEGAVSAGITGVLMLDALGRMIARRQRRRNDNH